jgi:Thioredoxin-like
MLGGGTFEMGKVKGKVVAVYYWTNWSETTVGDFAKLKLLLDTYGPKGFEVVCVSLDNTPEEAESFVKRTGAPGTHLAAAGGMDGKLANDYGVMMVPHLFLVGKDGKVVSRSLRVNALEDELKKLCK